MKLIWKEMKILFFALLIGMGLSFILWGCGCYEERVQDETPLYFDKNLRPIPNRTYWRTETHEERIYCALLGPYICVSICRIGRLLVYLSRSTGSTPSEKPL